MSITTVELFHRIGRRGRTGDFTRLGMSEQTDILQAANTSLQRLYNALPNYFKEMTQGFTLKSPLAISGVGVTQFAKTVTGITFTDDQFGQSVALEGDGAWNQIIGPAELLNPYQGPTGTVGGTLYGDAVHSTTVPLDRIIGNPQFANPSSAPFFRMDVGRINPQSQGWWPWQQTVGVPQMWWPQVFGNSQRKTPIMVVKFSPAPSQNYAINIRIGFWPQRLTLADYDANTTLGVPDQFIETSLIPMALQAFRTTPTWEKKGDEDQIDKDGDKGETFAKNQFGQIGAPNNRVYCPAGF